MRLPRRRHGDEHTVDVAWTRSKAVPAIRPSPSLFGSTGIRLTLPLVTRNEPHSPSERKRTNPAVGSTGRPRSTTQAGDTMPMRSVLSANEPDDSTLHDPTGPTSTSSTWNAPPAAIARPVAIDSAARATVAAQPNTLARAPRRMECPMARLRKRGLRGHPAPRAAARFCRCVEARPQTTPRHCEPKAKQSGTVMLRPDCFAACAPATTKRRESCRR
jgi:hypothetical protein